MCRTRNNKADIKLLIMSKDSLNPSRGISQDRTLGVNALKYNGMCYQDSRLKQKRAGEWITTDLM